MLGVKLCGLASITKVGGGRVEAFLVTLRYRNLDKLWASELLNIVTCTSLNLTYIPHQNELMK